MHPFNQWLEERGGQVASTINPHAEQICERVSARLAAAFPNLCFDPLRFDATSFQRQAFRETPRRFHRLLQVVLLCHSTAIIEREYRWGWKLLARFNVDRHHMLTQVRWYFEELFASVQLSGDDTLRLVEIRDQILEMIERTTTATPQVSEVSRRRRDSSNGHANGHVNGHQRRRS
jgi:hypothetical protein